MWLIVHNQSLVFLSFHVRISLSLVEIKEKTSKTLKDHYREGNEKRTINSHLEV